MSSTLSSSSSGASAGSGADLGLPEWPAGLGAVDGEDLLPRKTGPSGPTRAQFGHSGLGARRTRLTAWTALSPRRPQMRSDSSEVSEASFSTRSKAARVAQDRQPLGDFLADELLLHVELSLDLRQRGDVARANAALPQLWLQSHP